MNTPHQARYASIDLGFGFTKLSTPASPGSKHANRTLAFPSMAATSTADYRSLERSGIGVPNIVDILVDRVRYQVGPDVETCLSGRDLRVTSSHFFQGDTYKALYLGALAYMVSDEPTESTIDVLVVGLPLTVYQDEALQDQVRDLLTATHDLPVPGVRDVRRTLHILETIVVPQTIGSLFSLAQQHGDAVLEQMTSGTNLVIDVGYGTLMWMVSRGLNPALSRSGANMGGAHTLLSHVIRGISPQAEAKPWMLTRLDDNLRRMLGPPATADLESLNAVDSEALNSVFRKSVDPQQVAAALRTAIVSSLGELMAKIDDPDGIDDVWLVGGGAHLYASEVRRAFPRHVIHFDEIDTRYSNLRGFDIIGNRLLTANA